MMDGFTDLPEEVEAAMRQALAAGEYESSAALVSGALQEWALRRRFEAEADAALKAEIDLGIAEADAGRTVPFDPDAIMRTWRLQSARSRLG